MVRLFKTVMAVLGTVFEQHDSQQLRRAEAELGRDEAVNAQCAKEEAGNEKACIQAERQR